MVRYERQKGISNSQIFGLGLAAFLVLLGCRKTVPPKLTTEQQRDESRATVTEVQPSQSSANRYVGSQECQACHPSISESYAEHSMGRSASYLTGESIFPAASSSEFEADGFQYEMKKRGADWVHRQERLGTSGALADVTLPVSHLIGSGKNGQSFLVNREGHLFMSPMTWYPNKDLWDLSPGYETNNSQFNRPVVEQCLYCHTDGAHAQPSSINKFHEPIVRAHAIGCERCHGPGAAHVRTMQLTDSSPADDLQIVNPSKLSPDLREAVCQQCHLSGATRVLKPNRTLNDFQPGQPLSSAYTIFTIEQDGKNFVGHVEQMHKSACFQGSEGRLGCISCHDPHALPSAAEKVQFYRNRCLQCHTETTTCSLETPQRLAKSTDDNCVVCHMPRLSTEIRHAAVTDHSVPRIPKEVSAPKSTKASQLVAFPNSSAATPRDKAIALVNVSLRHPELLGDTTFEAVLKNLEKIVQANTKDFVAADALADLYLSENRIDDALRVCLDVLEESPERETTLLIVSETYSRTGQHRQAVASWEKLLSVNPWMAKYWYSLGKSYAALARWSRCKQLAIRGKQRFPTSIGLRHLLVESHLKLGESEAAETEFQSIVQFDPPKLDSLRRWYEAQKTAEK